MNIHVSEKTRGYLQVVTVHQCANNDTRVEIKPSYRRTRVSQSVQPSSSEAEGDRVKDRRELNYSALSTHAILLISPETVEVRGARGGQFARSPRSW